MRYPPEPIFGPCEPAEDWSTVSTSLQVALALAEGSDIGPALAAFDTAYDLWSWLAHVELAKLKGLKPPPRQDVRHCLDLVWQPLFAAVQAVARANHPKTFPLQWVYH